MKLFVTISLFIFTIIIISVLTVGLLNYNPVLKTNTILSSDNNDNYKLTSPNTDKNTVITITDSNKPTVQNSTITLDMIEIAKHNTANDCWIYISGNVYNLSGFSDSHSGGPNAILPYCGADGSNAFDTKNGRGGHSGNAKQILNSFLIDPLNSTVDKTKINGGN